MSDEIRWQRKPSEEVVGPHKDYHSNLSRAEKFARGTSKALIQGMRVYICDSNELKKSLLMICFTPPRNVQMGNYAVPIFLHASYSLVGYQTEHHFRELTKKAKSYWNSQQIQLEIEDAICF